MAAKCSSANVNPCRGCTNAKRIGEVVKAATVQRIIPAAAARAIAPPGANRRTNRGPINRKTRTSDNTDSDQRALMTGNPVPAARQRITENESCSAWLPSTRAAIMSNRRKAGISQEGGPVPRCRACKIIRQGRCCRNLGKQQSGSAANTKQRSAEPDYARQTITAGRPATQHRTDYECSGARRTQPSIFEPSALAGFAPVCRSRRKRIGEWHYRS